jgi:hypothetical protein
MAILSETAHLVKAKLASEYEAITIERAMIGLFLWVNFIRMSG